MDEDLDRRIDERLTSHKEELLSEISNMFKMSIDSSSSEISKLARKLDTDTPKFKRKSNEEQYKLNQKIMQKLEDVNTEDPVQRRVAVQEAMDMLSHRQKLIRLADASELGWRMANEYEVNPLAEDSEDERRIVKAEARAARKAKSEKGKKTRGRYNPYRGSSRASSRPAFATSQRALGPAPGAVKPGLCFACGKPGHWRNECPGTGPNKMSIYINSDHIAVNDTSADRDVAKCVSSEVGAKLCSTVDEIQAPSVETNSPVGRLKSHLTKRKQVTENKYVLDVVRSGYKLPLKTFPVSERLKNNRSALSNVSFVTEEIKSLEKKGIVKEVKEMPFVVNPLTVAFSRSGKPRLVLDCRHINPHLHLFKVKFEDIKVAEALFEPDSYVFTYDLKSAYHHIDIFAEHSTYLGFSWEADGELKHYVYCSLPFGLSTAGHIFTKMLRAVVAFLRSNGHKIIMFLDDGIGGDKSYEKALSSSKFTEKSILEFGFLLAQEKCNWKPRLEAVWLGYRLNFVENRIFIKEDRIHRLEIALENLLGLLYRDGFPVVGVKILASVIGQISSFHFVIGNKVRMLTRHMYNCVLTRASWSSPVLVSKKAIDEIRFWQKHVRSLNEKGRPLSEVTTCQVSVFCDASAIGYGGYWQAEYVSSESQSDRDKGLECEGLRCLLSDEGSYDDVGDLPERRHQSNDKCVSIESKMRLPEVSTVQYPGADRYGSPEVESAVVGLSQERAGMLPEVSTDKAKIQEHQIVMSDSNVVGSWTESESLKSSTWRETEAVRRVLQSNVSILKDKRVMVYSDNKNTTSVLMHGSRCADIHEVAADVAEFCESNNISMVTKWIPRVDNAEADTLSRCGDSDDLCISHSWFVYLDSIWGRHVVDRFSSSYNTHCEMFNSRWWVPGTSGVDAFCQNWGNVLNWIVPSPRLVVQCIRKMETDRAKGTVVVPMWRSSDFWACLVDTSNCFKNFIADHKILPKQGSVLVGKGNNGIFGKDPLPFYMIALKIKF